LTRPNPPCPRLPHLKRKEGVCSRFTTAFSSCGLRAELRDCYFTRRERAAVEGELKAAVAHQAELERAFDRAAEELRN
jgi:hypothetical protein